MLRTKLLVSSIAIASFVTSTESFAAPVPAAPTCDEVLSECDKTVLKLLEATEAWKRTAGALDAEVQLRTRERDSARAEVNVWWRQPGITWPTLFVIGVLGGVWAGNRLNRP